MSLFGEGIRRGALPPGSGGREVVGELEKTRAPWGLQLRPLRVGMGILGDIDGTPVEEEEQPLGTNTTPWETSSSEQESSEDGEESVSQNKRIVTKRLGNVMKHVKHPVEKTLPTPCFIWLQALVWAWPPYVNMVAKTHLIETFIFLMRVPA